MIARVAKIGAASEAVRTLAGAFTSNPLEAHGVQGCRFDVVVVQGLPHRPSRSRARQQRMASSWTCSTGLPYQVRPLTACRTAWRKAPRDTGDSCRPRGQGGWSRSGG